MGKNRGMGVRPLVDKSGPIVRPELGPCWIWIGARADNGYGLRWVDGKRVRAHRLKVCHECDTPLCVRPDHLFLGTDLDNAQDAKAKGRHAHGERMGGVRLNSREVQEIRQALHNGETQRALATRYGVCRQTVGMIAKGTNWAWLPEESEAATR